MEEISYTLFRDTELLSILLVCGIAFFVIKKLFLKNNKRNDIFNIVVVSVLYGIVSLWKLGTTSLPSTTWQPEKDLQSFILELTDKTHFDSVYALYGEGDNNSLNNGYQLGFNTILIEGSNDLNSWQEITTYTEGSIYQWEIIDGDWDYHYIKVTTTNKKNTLSEIGFKEYNQDSFLELSVFEDEYKDSKYPATLVIDEQDTLVVDPNWYHQSYFDEIYHPRNAWEIANGQYMYGTVHPLLGTCLMALSIKLLGLSPFAWRLPGALFGIFTIPFLYYLAKELFKDEKYSLLAIVLYACDFMHITTSRIGTLEPFSIFFIVVMFYYMAKYYNTDFYTTPFPKQLLILFLCGLSMGLGISVKWTACYSAVGLAIIIFTYFYKQYKRYLTYKKEGNSEYVKLFKSRMVETIIWCILVFIYLPVIVYFFVYVFTPVWRDGYSLQNVYNQIIGMYKYHATLEATHPYQSEWYMWIFDTRPIWYYSGTSFEPYKYTIACFSNPILCWTGFITIVWTCYLLFKDKKGSAFIIVIGYLTAILPWVLIKRCVFAYHFYPTSIFMILSVAYCAKYYALFDGKYKKYARIWLAIVVIVFILFLPVTCGFGTSLNYIHLLRWLPSWYFG